MTTLLDAVLRVGRKIHGLRSGTADSGSQTTCVDSNRNESDDVWNEGIFIDITNSEWSRISDFANSSGTITFDEKTTGVDTGDKYAVILPKFPLDAIIEGINDALQEIEYVLEDTTSLDTVDDQTIYTLPVGITAQNLAQVWAQRENDSSTDDMWKKLRNWEVHPKAIGTQHELVIESAIDGGYGLRLVYTSYHPYLDDIDDEISPMIPLERIVPRAAYNVMASQFHFGSANKWELQQADRFYNESIIAEAKHLVPKPQFDGKAVVAW